MKLYFYILLSLFFLSSCWVSKVEKKSYKENKDLRKSEPILIGVYDGAVSRYVLTIRENGYFDVSEGSMFGKYYKSGNWNVKNDTILLNYTNNNKEKFENGGIFYKCRHSSL